MNQLDYMDTLEPVHRSDLTRQEKSRILQYLMFLKRKRCGRIKARGCADGRPQRVYLTKADTSSPTVSIEGFMLSCVIDAKEGRSVATVDLPGAFLQTDQKGVVHVRLVGAMADLLLSINSDKYSAFVRLERGETCCTLA